MLHPTQSSRVLTAVGATLSPPNPTNACSKHIQMCQLRDPSRLEGNCPDLGYSESTPCAIFVPFQVDVIG